MSFVRPMAAGGYVDIGEAARRAGVSPATLRMYERRGLLPPPMRSASGYRKYAPEDIRRARLVRRARRAGLPMRHIDRLLARGGEPDCLQTLLREHLCRLEHETARLSRIRRHLWRWLSRSLAREA